MVTEIMLMDEDFTPPTSGRRPVVEVNDLIGEADDNVGRWAGKNYNSSQGSSAIRQLRTMRTTHNLDYASRKEVNGTTTVFVRVNK